MRTGVKVSVSDYLPYRQLRTGSGIWGNKDIKPQVFLDLGRKLPTSCCLGNFPLWLVMLGCWTCSFFESFAQVQKLITYRGTYQSLNWVTLVALLIRQTHPCRPAPSTARFLPKKLKGNLIWKFMISPLLTVKLQDGGNTDLLTLSFTSILIYFTKF